MESIIFVGGMQFSGKSTLCKNLESVDAKYKHMSLDVHYRHLGYQRDVFLNVIKKDNRFLFNQIKKLAKKCDDVEDKADQMTLFANYMIHEGRYDEFQVLHRDCALSYSGKLINSLDNSLIPVVDGLFINRMTRRSVYNGLKKSLSNKCNLDELRKIMVFFDLGVETSLIRYKSKTRKDNPHIECNEITIIKSFKDQEIPVKEELPNLDVLIIKSELEINPTISHILEKAA